MIFLEFFNREKTVFYKAHLPAQAIDYRILVRLYKNVAKNEI